MDAEVNQLSACVLKELTICTRQSWEHLYNRALVFSFCYKRGRCRMLTEHRGESLMQKRWQRNWFLEEELELSMWFGWWKRRVKEKALWVEHTQREREQGDQGTLGVWSGINVLGGYWITWLNELLTKPPWQRNDTASQSLRQLTLLWTQHLWKQDA